MLGTEQTLCIKGGNIQTRNIVIQGEISHELFRPRYFWYV